jgi:hypothetical protein
MNSGKGPASRRSKKRKFYRFEVDLSGGGKGHGVEIANYDALITPGLVMFAPPPPHWLGFADLPETPQLVYNRREGKMPRDHEGMGFYKLASEKLKGVLETIDPEAFVFEACDFTLPDGTKGPQYFLYDVVRVLDAIDEEESEFRIWYEGERKIYDFLGDRRIEMRHDISNDYHVFRTPFSGSVVFCDDSLREMCKAEKVTGVSFRNLGTKR